MSDCHIIKSYKSFKKLDNLEILPKWLKIKSIPKLKGISLLFKIPKIIIDCKNIEKLEVITDTLIIENLSENLFKNIIGSFKRVEVENFISLNGNEIINFTFEILIIKNIASTQSLIYFQNLRNDRYKYRYFNQVLTISF